MYERFSNPMAMGFATSISQQRINARINQAIGSSQTRGEQET
jgi:hypothetical protein